MVGFKFKALLATNVLLDVLCTPKRPSADASALIFQAIRSGYLEGVITTQRILDAAYILSRISKPFDREAFGRSILSIMDFVNIDAIHFLDIRDAIITSDREFRRRKESSGLPFYTPEAFVARLRRR